MALESTGWTVLEAADGATTIEVLSTTEIDLCVMDRYMPGTPLDSRLEFLGRLHPRAAVVVLSGDSRERPRASDDVVYLGKPINLDDLHNGVAQAFILANRSPGTASL